MRHFILIKEYPSSPIKGTIVSDTNKYTGEKDGYFSLNYGFIKSENEFKLPKNHMCEQFPEYWKEYSKNDSFDRKYQ